MISGLMTSSEKAQLLRMRAHAKGYLADGRKLQQMTFATSDGGYLLQLIGFEVLLKAALRVHGTKAAETHRYRALFRSLPQEVQDRLLDKANSRFGPHANFSNLDTLLDTWSSNFVKLRYAYESYEGMSAEESARRGEDWIAAGARIEDADFQYYPLELQALTEALLEELPAA